MFDCITITRERRDHKQKAEHLINGGPDFRFLAITSVIYFFGDKGTCRSMHICDLHILYFYVFFLLHMQKAVGRKNSVFSTYHLPQSLLKRNMKIEKNQLTNMHGCTCTFVPPKINLREILPKNENQDHHFIKCSAFCRGPVSP